MTSTFQPSFAGGIMSSGMYARNDVVKYQVGVKDALNVFIRPQGGVSNRAGMRAIGADTGPAGHQVLIPFEFSADEGYQLEFVAGVFRVLYMGGYILDPAFGTKTVAYTPDGTFTLAAHGLVANDVVEVRNMPDGSGNMLVRVSGVTPNTFNVEGAGVRPSVGGNVQVVRAYTAPHPYLGDELPDVRYAQDANDIYLVHLNHPPHKLRRLGHANWQSAPVSFAPGILPPDNTPGPITITNIEANTDPWWTLAAGHGLTVGTSVVFGADTWDSASDWGRIQLGVFRVKQVSGNQVRLQRVDGGPVLNTSGLSFGAVPPNPRLRRAGVGLRWPAGVTETPNPDELVYAVASVNAEGEESEAIVVGTARHDLTFAGSQATPLWNPRAGAVRYIVYRRIGGEFGYIGSTPDTWFGDANIAPDMSQGPQTTRNPFNGPGDYPSVVAFHEQRLFLAATKNDPQKVEGSQSGRPNNFSVSRPPRPSDAVAFRPRYRQVNAIRALVSGPQLILLTGGGEWVVSGGGDGGALTPDNLFLHPISYWGADAAVPILIGDVLAFVQRGGRVIRDFPLRGGDNDASRPTDLTIMATDLFTAPVSSWAFAQVPHGVVWVALEDGTVLSLTYLAEHDVWGWTRHELGGGGRVKQFSVCMEAGTDIVYAVVERDAYGSIVRRTERMDIRSDDPVEGLFLDGAVTVRNTTPQYRVGGLRVLAGRLVSAVVDGRVYTNVPVDDFGFAELPEATLAGKVWHVGMPYRAEIETLPIDFGEVREIGSTHGRLKRLNSVAVQVAKTRGVLVGRNRTNLEEAKEWGYSMDALPSHTKTFPVPVQGDWLREASLVVSHPYPLPFTLLSVSPDWEIGT